MGKGEKAKEYFLKGYNCAQSVACAFSEEVGIEEKTLAKMVSAFGGGVGRMREMCGAVLGATFVISCLYGYDTTDDVVKKQELYRTVQEALLPFKEKYGTFECGELLGKKGEKITFVPEKRTEEFYKTRPCGGFIEYVAGLLEKELKRQELEKRGR